MPKLILMFDDVAVREYPLAKQEILIGRSSKAAIELEDSTVSSRHAVLESEFARDRTQTFYIRDLASKNGTYVHGRRISRTPLQNGDQFKIGWSTFRFECSEATPA